MDDKLGTVIELQRALDELRQAERQLAGVPEWMEELHAEHSARRAEIAAAEEAAEEALRTRRKAEAATADAEARLKHFQQQVSLVRTQREYSALLQEIDTVKAQIKGLDEQALGSMEQVELQQRRKGELEEAFRDLDGRYGEALARWHEQRPGVEQQAETLRARVAELRARLPRGLVALYERIAERRGGDALAPVRRMDAGPGSGQIWHCGACNYRVRLQVVADIRTRGALVQCDGCKRILFVDEEPV
jgi:predicted  nucleic acid-binding Zn-ribbon protein